MRTDLFLSNPKSRAYSNVSGKLVDSFKVTATLVLPQPKIVINYRFVESLRFFAMAPVGKLHILTVFALWSLRQGVADESKKCQLVFDGRIAPKVDAADFDKNSSIYDHQSVHGESTYPSGITDQMISPNYPFSDQTWAQIIKFPRAIPPSLVRRVWSSRWRGLLT
jgi:hypothetical protein